MKGKGEVVEEKKMEEEVKKSPINLETQPVRLSFSEFAGSLTGGERLLVEGMKVQYSNKKQTLAEWRKDLTEFGQKEV